MTLQRQARQNDQNSKPQALGGVPGSNGTENKLDVPPILKNMTIQILEQCLFEAQGIPFTLT